MKTLKLLKYINLIFFKLNMFLKHSYKHENKLSKNRVNLTEIQ